MNNLITEATIQTDEELSAQFRRCEKWQDADQWDILGFLYFARGYMMNAGYCFRKSDELRVGSFLELVQA